MRSLKEKAKKKDYTNLTKMRNLKKILRCKQFRNDLNNENYFTSFYL